MTDIFPSFILNNNRLGDYKMDKNIILHILEGIHNNEEPRFFDLDIDKETFGKIVETMQNAGLISGAKIAHVGLENKVAVVSLHTAEVEVNGLHCLNNIKKTQQIS